MVKIRLRRVGAKKQPYYRVVVADSRSPRNGRFIENIGNYNPRTDPPTFHLEEGRAIYWMQRGAQPTDAVLRMLKKLGTLEKLERVKAGEPLTDVLAEAAEELAAVPEEVEEAVVKAEEVEAAAVAEEKAAAPSPSEVSIESLGVSTRVMRVLSEAGIETVEDVLSRLKEGKEAVLGLPGLGEKSLEEIEEALRARGFLE
jgi:small subunit ribosomal protein S16